MSKLFIWCTLMVLSLAHMVAFLLTDEVSFMVTYNVFLAASFVVLKESK